MTTPNFIKGIGKLALDRFDAQKHFNGTEFRHTADQIDIENPSLVFGDPATVEEALEDLNTFVISQLNAGVGFAVVPDGYDTWHNANGTINFDNTVPSLDTFLNPLFTAIVNNTTLPTGFDRIKRGGVLLIKAGTYTIANTVNIPPGFTLLGEGYGTKIVNITSLNISVLPPIPKISPTPNPVFRILADGYRAAVDGAVDPTTFVFQRETRIMNMVISDNFVEPTVLGDTFYKLPQNKTSSTTSFPPPIIWQQLGSSLALFNVIATGRVNFSSGQIVSQATGNLIFIDTSTADTQTFCKIDNCFIDGFSVPLDFTASVNGQDYLEVKNSKIRGYGYFGGDSTDGYANTIIASHAQNINILGNTIYGNATNVSSLLYLSSPGSTPNLQARSKISIVGNQVIINKLSNSTNATFLPIYYSSSFITPTQSISALVYGNSFQDTFDIYVDDGYQFSSPGIGSPQFSINRTTKKTTIRNDIIELDGYATIINGNPIVNGAFGVTGNSTLPTIVGNTSIPVGSTLQISGSENINPGATLNLTGAPSNPATIMGNSYSILNMTNGSKLNIAPTIVPGSSYTVDSGAGFDIILLIAFTSSGSVSVTLPDATVNLGRYLIIKDSGGNATSNHITIHTPVLGQLIDGSSTIAIVHNYNSVVLISNGIQWYVISGLNQNAGGTTYA